MAQPTIYYATTTKQAATSLGWVLKEYNIRAEAFITTFPDRDDDPRKRATKRVTKGYQEVSTSFARPQSCIAVASGIYLRSEDGTFNTHAGTTIESILAHTQSTEQPCEIRHTLAYIDNDRRALFPDLFDSTLLATIAAAPCGEVKEFHPSKLATIIKPLDCGGKTLAELPFVQYKLWFKEHCGYGRMFGERVTRIGPFTH